MCILTAKYFYLRISQNDFFFKEIFGLKIHISLSMFFKLVYSLK